MKKVLFVCLGNICRSPAAEALFKKIVQNESKQNHYFIDSAGTSAHHVGELADPRMREAAIKKDIDITSRSRQFTKDDFQEFDHIITMDESNYNNVVKLAQSEQDKSKVRSLMSYHSDAEFDHVPDPYFGGNEGFDIVLDLLEETLAKFYLELKSLN